MMSKSRENLAKRRAKRNKNFVPTILLTLVFWVMWVALVWLVDPEVLVNLPPKKSYWPFFILLFLALFLTLALLLKNTRRGLVISLGVIGFLILRLNGLGHIINGLLLVGIIMAIELYSRLK
jgi:hypothetical protein